MILTPSCRTFTGSLKLAVTSVVGVKPRPGRGFGRVGKRYERHHADRRADDVCAVDLHVLLLYGVRGAEERRLRPVPLLLPRDVALPTGDGSDLA